MNEPTATPPRLLEQLDWACLRLLNRLTGPEVDSGGNPDPGTCHAERPS